jgi:hypothetical protein
MSATAAQIPPALRQPGKLGSQTLLIRFALAALAVAISYCLRWESLRFLTSETNLRIDQLWGVHLQRISFDTVMWKGALYQYQNACTSVDVWFGSIPLLWNLRKSWACNVFFALAVGAGMFFFNVFRLSVSDVLFAAGLSWNLAHNVVSGISYFVVWIWIWKRLRGNTLIDTTD